MSAPNVVAMRRSLAALGDYLEQAIGLTAEAQDAATSDAGLAREQAIVGNYIELARGELDRFQEAANGRCT